MWTQASSQVFTPLTQSATGSKTSSTPGVCLSIQGVLLRGLNHVLLPGFLQWLWWKTRRSFEGMEELGGTLLSVSPSCATRGRLLAGSPLPSPMLFRWVSSLHRSDETKIYQGWFYFGASSMFWFAFKFAGFLEDDKVEPEEEANEVRDRPSQSGGNWAGP